eukprot:TRINITY_DN642_c0_g1_i1.p1 TRINITY_DN642_c0_g1~~TRINITY_DN642_c0_g1_i1.p1  ORF type:complete len:1385 (-),score=366.10 TRINITY_DN642_c0_g1_i1:72-3695(-)
MTLEDGRFIMNPTTFDALLQQKGYTPAQLHSLKIYRAHPHFRVIALTLPTPKYEGNPLDPPLRSRFQGRFVHDVLDDSLLHLPPESSHATKWLQVLQFARIIQKMDHLNQDKKADLVVPPPEFSTRGLLAAAEILRLFPQLRASSMINMIYPYQFINKKNFLKFDGLVQAALKKLKEGELKDDRVYEKCRVIVENGVRIVELVDNKGEVVKRVVPHGSLQYKFGDDSGFINTASSDALLTKMMISHTSGSDFCLIGKKGSGKSFILQKFASLLGYKSQTLLLYKDMNYRDLLQRRVTRENGDTAWENSNLIVAALEGDLGILDNIHRLHPNAIEKLSQLVIDRQVILPDGSRLVHYDHYQKLKEIYSEEELREHKVLPIHKHFRLVSIGNTPTDKSDYLTAETAGLFDFHEVSAPSPRETSQIVEQMCPKLPKGTLSKLTRFSELFNSTKEFQDSPFTMRQLLRSAKLAEFYHSHFNIGNLYKILTQMVLYEFMPRNSKLLLEQLLKNLDIKIEKITKTELLLTNLKKLNEDHSEHHWVPKIQFFQNPRHDEILEDMAMHFDLGEHLLLIGNQGTGKNKLVDRFLEIRNLPRRYIQLHRDTTVASLTSQASVVNGCIVWEDSPLVHAARDGHILVIDEADKAEMEVITVLKNLIDGEMVLMDNRRLLSAKLFNQYPPNSPNLIRIHPNFRLIVLANRPGYPFLGNNFFNECGELFSIHPVDNPDKESEFSLLKFYGPSVPDNYINILLTAFHHLREKHREGLLAYPYSTREIVNIVKHLQKYPGDDFIAVLQNVFSFDLTNDQVMKHIQDAFSKSGVKLPSWRDVPIAKEKLSLTISRNEFQTSNPKQAEAPKHGKVDPDNKPHVGGNTWAGGTGGRDTAGLGGKGGPYRLDAGHDVHQVSDEEKANVDKEIIKKAKEMASEGLHKRLAEIEMTAYEDKAYQNYYRNVEDSISELRNILENLKFKKSSRQWVRFQTTGDLDENRLVEGITGEKTIYKRRIHGDNAFNNFPDTKAQIRISFVMDISASMYRFNGYDKRLQRMLESAVMIMESFEGWEDKFLYNIVGHSGDDPEVQLVQLKQTPKNRMERLKVLQKMVAHSQYCWAGDTTLEATQRAIQNIVKEEADQYFVFVLSDANLDRYRIDPKAFASILSEHPEVNAFAILIASLWEGQAEKLLSKLPPGKGSTCMDPKQLPSLLFQFLSEILLK